MLKFCQIRQDRLNLWADRSGNIAIMFALMLVPLIGIVGLAVDTARAYSVKQRLQESIDSAALVAGRNFNDPHRDQMIADYFHANWRAGFMGSDTPVLTFSTNTTTREVTVVARVNMPTLFMRMFSISSVTVGTLTSSVSGMTYLEVALALDNTSSMRTMIGPVRRIDAMKTAATNFIDTLYAGDETVDNMWVSIVPFTSMVNVGQQHSSFLAAGSTNNILWDYPKNSTAQNQWRGCLFERSFYNEGTYAGRDMTDDNPSVEPFWPYHVPLAQLEVVNTCSAQYTMHAPEAPAPYAPPAPPGPTPPPTTPPAEPCTKVVDGYVVSCKVLDGAAGTLAGLSNLPNAHIQQTAGGGPLRPETCQYGGEPYSSSDYTIYRPALSYQTPSGVVIQYPSVDGIHTRGYNAAYPALANDNRYPAPILTAPVSVTYPNGDLSPGAQIRTILPIGTTMPYVVAEFDMGAAYLWNKIVLSGGRLIPNFSGLNDVNMFRIQGSQNGTVWENLDYPVHFADYNYDYVFELTKNWYDYDYAPRYRYLRIVRSLNPSPYSDLDPVDAKSATIRINKVEIYRQAEGLCCADSFYYPNWSGYQPVGYGVWSGGGRWIAPWPNASSPKLGGWGNSGCGLPMLPLTAKRSDLLNKINEMDVPPAPSGAKLSAPQGWSTWDEPDKGYNGTIINEGLVWGWRSISEHWRGWWKNPNGTAIDASLPLDHGITGGSKAVVVMTDGLNFLEDYAAVNGDSDPYFGQQSILLPNVNDPNLLDDRPDYSDTIPVSGNWDRPSYGFDSSAYGLLRVYHETDARGVSAVGDHDYWGRLSFCRQREAAGFEPHLALWGCREEDAMIRTPSGDIARSANEWGNFTLTAALTGPYYDELMRRMLVTCSAMRADKIRIFFILFDIDNNPQKASALSAFNSCVGTDGGVYDAADPAQLNNAFQQIAVKLRTLRLKE